MKALRLWPSLCFISQGKGLVGNLMGGTHTLLSLGTAKHAIHSALCYQFLHIRQSKSPIIHCLPLARAQVRVFQFISELSTPHLKELVQVLTVSDISD